MRKLYRKNTDWKAIVFGGAGLPLSDQELLEFISTIVSRDDVQVILTENANPKYVLKYNLNTSKFSEHPISF